MASHGAILDSVELPRDFRRALGFPAAVPTGILLDHFDAVLDVFHAARQPLASPVLRSLRKAVFGIYSEIGRRCPSTTAAAAETEDDDELEQDEDETENISINDMHERYGDRRCLWHERTLKFWEPENAFRSDVSYLRPYMLKVLIEKPQRSDLGLTVLGRREEPGIRDLVRCLNEHTAAHGEEPLSPAVITDVLRLYSRIVDFLSGGADPVTSGVHNAPVLTAASKLVPALAVVEEDTPAFEGKFDPSQLHVMHSQVPLAFAKPAGVLAISSLVVEELTTEPRIISEGSCAESCRSLTLKLNSEDFKKGLRRLIQAERPTPYAEDLGWLSKVSIVAVYHLSTTLTLTRQDGTVLADTAEPEFLADQHRIYLTEAVLPQYAFYLAQAINQKLGGDRLQNVSPLALILTVPEQQIDVTLTRAKIRRLAGGGELVEEEQETPDRGGMVYEGDGETADEPTLDSCSTETPPPSSEVVPADEQDVDGTELDSSGEAPADTPAAPSEDEAAESEAPHAGPTALKSKDPPTQSHDEERESQRDDVSEDDEGYSRSPDSTHGGVPAGSSRTTGSADGEGKRSSPSGYHGGGRTTDAPPTPGPRQPGDGTKGHHPLWRHAAKGRAVTYVVPEGEEIERDPANDEEPQNMRVGKAAVDAVLKEERSRHWRPVEKAHNNPGYDIESTSPEGAERRYIEVKGIQDAWTTVGVPVSKTQFDTARTLGEEFGLYVVEFAGDPQRQKIHKIQDPAAHVTQFRFDNGWQSLGAEASKQKQPPEISPREPKGGERVRLADGRTALVIKTRRMLGGLLSLVVEIKGGPVKTIQWHSRMQIIS